MQDLVSTHHAATQLPLETVKTLVQGTRQETPHIELLKVKWLNKNVTLAWDEEAKIKGLPLNVFVSSLLDYDVFGNIVILQKGLGKSK